MASYADFWRDEVLLPRDTAVAAGVAYHFTEMLLPQLAAVAAEGLAPPPAAAVDALLAPYAAALAGTADPVLLRRLQSGLFGPVAEEVREPGEGRPLKHLDVGALAARLFELGEPRHLPPRCDVCCGVGRGGGAAGRAAAVTRPSRSQLSARDPSGAERRS
jgi:hypothetical protein